MDERMEVPVLYLDIDGTVREGKDDALGRFVNTPSDVRVFPEAKELIKRWKAGGGRIVGISNQGGVATGQVSYLAMKGAMSETIRQCDDLFDRMMVCPHKPSAGCECRKPGTWMVLKAILELGKKHPEEKYPANLALFVGDRVEDKKCAEACGIDFMDAKDWRAQIQ